MIEPSLRTSHLLCKGFVMFSHVTLRKSHCFPSVCSEARVPALRLTEVVIAPLTYYSLMSARLEIGALHMLPPTDVTEVAEVQGFLAFDCACSEASGQLPLCESVRLWFLLTESLPGRYGLAFKTSLDLHKHN